MTRRASILSDRVAQAGRQDREREIARDERTVCSAWGNEGTWRVKNTPLPLIFPLQPEGFRLASERLCLACVAELLQKLALRNWPRGALSIFSRYTCGHGVAPDAPA